MPAKGHAQGQMSEGVTYSPEIAVRICERIAEGDSVRKICSDPGFPNRSSVAIWLRDHPDFREMHAIAWLERIEGFAHELIDIADDGSNDYMERLAKDGAPTGTYFFNAEAVARSRLRIDTRRWILAKMLPRKYGARIELDLPEGARFPGDNAKAVQNADAPVVIENDPLYQQFLAWERAAPG